MKANINAMATKQCLIDELMADGDDDVGKGKGRYNRRRIVEGRIALFFGGGHPKCYPPVIPDRMEGPRQEVPAAADEGAAQLLD